MISAVLVCLNEAEKLEKCLRSLVGFADEIVVLDLGSTDGSTDISKKYHAKIFQHNFVPVVEEVRNYAISKASGDWILVLDPDEILSDKLRDKLKQISSKDEFAAVNIPRKNIFFGHWIAYTNWWPDRHIRFFQKEKVKWRNIIHSYPEVKGEVLNLAAEESLAIAHFGYKTLSEFMDRQNRYSAVEAQNLYDNGARFTWSNFFWKPTREFLVRFVKHTGFLDGFYGFALTFLMMVYQLEVMVKLWELEQKK